MSGDKRSVATDALETLGTIIDENAGRDAIHLAVEPAIAGGMLHPGEDVGFLENGTVGQCDKPVGIVDPFLKMPVKPGQRFWLVVYPRQITSLRHVWEHPAFAKSEQPTAAAGVMQSSKIESEAWLRDFCDHADCPGYEAVMGLITGQGSGAEDGYYDRFDEEYLHFDGRDAHGEIPPEFWYHAEIVTGMKFEGRKPSYFSCSC
jgi:hypothetical protein